MAAASLVGKPLGDYDIKRLVGAGAMGEVYEATKDHQSFAIKIITPELAKVDALRERFLREVRLMQAVHHPHIVSILDFGWQDERLFLVMPFIDGMSLHQHLRQRSFSPADTWTMFSPLSDALIHVHLQGIIHRDIKPGNVLVANRDSHVYLTDFGLSKRPDIDTRLTETGTVVGTPYFMSPEMVVGEAVDARSDIYSLGVMLYLMLLDRLPFDSGDDQSTMYAHVYEPVPPPESINPHFPQRLSTVLLTALEKYPQYRFSSVKQFKLEFREALDSLTEEEQYRTYGSR